MLRREMDLCLKEYYKDIWGQAWFVLQKWSKSNVLVMEAVIETKILRDFVDDSPFDKWISLISIHSDDT